MIFSAEYAKERKYKTMRLDAFIQNPAAVGLYRKLDYTEVGVVEFRIRYQKTDLLRFTIIDLKQFSGEEGLWIIKMYWPL